MAEKNILVPLHNDAVPAQPDAGDAPLTLNSLKDALRHDHDLRTLWGNLIISSEKIEGVLTWADFAARFGPLFKSDPDVYRRIADTAYESDVSAERTAPPPPAP